jgi:hypothetical protein
MVKLSDFGYDVMDTPNNRSKAMQKIVDAGHKISATALLYNNSRAMLKPGKASKFHGIISVSQEADGKGRRYYNDAKKMEKMSPSK